MIFVILIIIELMELLELDFTIINLKDLHLIIQFHKD